MRNVILQVVAGIITAVLLAGALGWGMGVIKQERDNVANKCPAGTVYLVNTDYGAACVQGFYIDGDGNRRDPLYRVNQD